MIGKYGKEIGENRNFHIVSFDTSSAPVFLIKTCKLQSDKRKDPHHDIQNSSPFRSCQVYKFALLCSRSERKT